MLAILGWLAKSFVSQLLAKDMTLFKESLKSESELAVRKLQYDIQKSVIEYELKLAKLHEKRADVIAETYGLLIQCHRDVLVLVFPPDYGERSSLDENYKIAMNSINVFFEFFGKKRIYLPEELCSRIDKFVMEVRENAIVNYQYIKQSEKSHLEEHKYKIDKGVSETRKFLDENSKIMMAELENDLRKMMEEVSDIS